MLSDLEGTADTSALLITALLGGLTAALVYANSIKARGKAVQGLANPITAITSYISCPG